MTRNKDWFPEEGDWTRLFDDKELSTRRRSAEKKYRDFTEEQIKHIRKRAKNDLFFLAGSILGYDLISPTFHGHYFRWLEATRGERYRMTLLARDHYKSTGNTISESIQMALPNDAEVQEHPYYLGPNIRILLGHETRESASRFLFEITEAFRAKPPMLAFFPDCIPIPRQQRMNKWELELPRGSHWKEPTFDTIGAGGAAQGRHYNHLKLDDLIGEDARDSETVMKRVLDWFDNANSLLARLKFDGWDLVGTRWAASDVYSHALKMYGVNKKRSLLEVYSQNEIDKLEDGELHVYARGALNKMGLPAFPEEFDLKDLNRIRKNPRVWAAQYANNPKDSELTKFRPHWLKTYNVGSSGRLYIFDGEGTWSVDPRSLDRLLLIDPSMGETKSSDETGVVVTGTDPRLNIYALEAFKKRLKPPELIDLIFQLYVKWRPRLVSIESVAFSAALAYWFNQKCNQLRMYPSVYHYKPGSKRSKTARIEGLGNYGAAGQIYILDGMHQLRDEWEWFPLGDSEHILDAFAQGQELWAPGLKEEDREDLIAAEQTLSEERDAATGY